MTSTFILDFGMHEGEDTEFYLALGAKVIAFEGNPELVERNKIRFAAQIESGDLTIVAGAIVPPEHESETVIFYTSDDKSVWGTADTDWVERNMARGFPMKEVVTPAVKLDNVLAELPQAYFVKIDIEGADEIVLHSLERTNYLPEYISIESENVDFDGLVGEVEQMKAMGYTRFAAVQQATIPGSRLKARGFDGKPVDYRFRKHASGAFGAYLPDDAFKSAEEVIEDYRRIFRSYRKFGAPSPLRRSRLTRFPLRVLNYALLNTINYPLCGWHDLHAKR